MPKSALLPAAFSCAFLVLLLSPSPAPASTATFSAPIPICGSGPRVTCIVDGDTFWLDGNKIRIADIDTPEVSRPRCEQEKRLGKAATRALQGLLSAGAFTLQRGARDRDRYNRLLRTIHRGPINLGARLVDQGLARPWTGSRQGWC
ncbi:thermonuclease family protein [Parerythrobacter jejuensis]|uniref:Thermonuclease family protein n=1 Tax=Parerythrobacter jejuensis TaxID=795812 RepID=A0A845APV8_9SPHN|nr:thermonuclease family protein [Parerythrobacter jejuensis]MXP31233.1 thermonuclease family protein [Parerythrobacter jejuensis]MXP33993.1 thermonuclease family protein [Parerythrobacter jejuensis]